MDVAYSCSTLYTASSVITRRLGLVTECVFCDIIARKERGTIRYETDDLIVIDNILRWVPLMLLAMPKRHMSQEEMWQDLSGIGAIAVEMGKKYCPGGFRLVSNFGRDAMQSQIHAHLHILGGGFLGHYV